MDYKVCDHSVNIIAYRKNNVNYAMCCAWSMMVDYDKMVSLLGRQSVTGNNIKKGDIIGFSSLAFDQKSIARKLGDLHSDEVDKLNGISYTIDGDAILIDDAKSEIVCEVIDVLHLEGIEEDNLVYFKILKYKGNDKKWLYQSDANDN